MLQFIFKLIFGSKFERDIKAMRPVIEKINALEPQVEALSDEALRGRTIEFRERIAKGESLDSILPEAFAVVRETSRRTLQMRHFDVQLMGGISLHQGKISEMKTGEGKTLTSTLAIYLNALTGRGVHVVTVNDYLAKRDAEWMEPIYYFHGLTVGINTGSMSNAEKRKAYASDITYGTNNEFGFDYLRDNMVEHVSFRVQRGHYFAIVDEVDSILVDEARTPLIISGPAEHDTGTYVRVNRIIPSLADKTDFDIDEKARNVTLTEMGVARVEKLLVIENLYDPANVELVHHVHQCLKAHYLFAKDVDYVVQNGEIIIVDEFTGRLMEGRRYSDGLHQALEAKENVPIKQENQTLATVTFQNYFRMYEKLAGMTGTADTEAEEFRKIYKLDVIVLPTNQPVTRIDHSDKIYRTEREKFNAIAEEVKERHLKGQPVLLGTVSIENSEKLSKLLSQRGIPHAVLNAKHHDREAEIVKEAGEKAKVTIATNMAGRGTDIKLGEGVRELGGLHIIGSERHESRRIDNQLRGRSGRQGDPGSSRFYLSLEDSLMRIFGSDRIAPIMQRFGMEEGEAIEHGMVSGAIERAQKRVEGHNFDIRKHLLEYDDVMNAQRKYIYQIRDEILLNESIENLLREHMEDILTDRFSYYLSNRNPSDWDLEGLADWLSDAFEIDLKATQIEMETLNLDEARKVLSDMIEARYNEKRAKYGDQMNILEKMVSLQVIDQKWKDHLYAIDQLREGVWTLGYAQRNPLVEYRMQAFNLFKEMVSTAKEETIQFVFRAEIRGPLTEEVPAEYQQVGRAVHSNVDSLLQPVNIQTGGMPIMSVRHDTTAPKGDSEAAKKTAGGASQRKSSRRRK